MLYGKEITNDIGVRTMKYGYVYRNQGEDIVKAFPTDIEKLYVDRDFDNLISTIKKSDQLYIYSIAHVAKDHENLIKRLQMLQEKSVSYLYQGTKKVPIDELLEFYEYVEDSKRTQMREHQQQGIIKALEKKSLGKGTYGRPKVEMPEDFEDNILLIMKKKKTHAEYMKQSGLKRATYFKLLRQVKDGWKEKELDQYLENKEREHEY